jgi:arginyl-tRNA--protein-N-Asp/Glu arginylyltransferase/GMP synthase-like glutamine amidotransferase
MQIIISALGGKITKMKEPPKGTPEQIEIIDDKFYEFNFYKNIGIEKQKYLKISEAHGDEISEYPDEKYKIKLFGSSKSCKNEIMVDEKEKILLIQGHPEYHPQFNSHRVAKFYIQFRLKKEPTKEEIEKFIDDYIKKKDYLNIVNNFIENDNLFSKNNLIRNLNRKFGDYSSNIIIILLNYIKKILPNENENLQNKIFDSIKNFYEQNDSFKQNYKITLSEKTFHLNFIVNNTSEYNEFISKIQKENKEPEKQQNKKPFTKKKDKKNNNNNNNNIIENKTESESEKYYSLEYFDEIITEPKIKLPLKHTYTCELSDIIEAQPDRHEVYKKYQKLIHKDKDSELKESRYNDAWGESNLYSSHIPIPYPPNFFQTTPHPNIYPKKYGTYNFIHKIDGKIIAVGVWDILPTSLSSVYLYYDTDYSFLDLGVFTAVREIEYMRNFQKLVDPNFKYYMMGFYIDTCQKMKYKGFYHPMEILDPFTMNYVYLDDVRDIIKDNKIHQLSKEKNVNFKSFTNDEIDKIINDLLIDFKGKKISFIQFVFSYINEKYIEQIINTVKRFISLIGKDVFNSIEFIAKFNRF